MMMQRSSRLPGACRSSGAGHAVAPLPTPHPQARQTTSRSSACSPAPALAEPTATARRALGAFTQQRSRAGRVTCRASAGADFRTKAPKDVRVLVVGPTGYIGKFVTQELIKRGYNVVAFSREKAGIKGKLGKDDIVKDFAGATCRFGDVSNLDSIRNVAFEEHVDVVVSCLASRTGGKKDSWAIDYQATKNVLDVAREKGASHFVLLSAICVQKPTLEFQKAKLQLEADLAAAGDITYSIVRPTAFFKSVAGQIELVKQGKPYVMFGDGQLASCKPISESDLANFISDCISEKDKINKVLPIGGPGKAYSAKEQADMLFRITGQPTNYFPVPVALMDGIIGMLDFFAKFFPAQFEDAAEFGRIGKYYAVESMLVWDPVKQVYLEDATPSYGKDTLEAFFTKAVKEGLAGQELGDQAVFGVNE